MANGHVEIHNPISNHNNLNNSSDCNIKSTSDTSDMDDTVEFRILMAYATRRRPKKADTTDNPVVVNGNTDANGSAPSQTPEKTEPTNKRKEEKKKKKENKKGLKRMLSILKCVKPQTEEEEEEEPQPAVENHHNVDDRCRFRDFKEDEDKEEDSLEDVANRLTKIANGIQFVPEIESDAPDDENEDSMERLIGLILRESGDRLNEQELRNVAVVREIFWDYSFFKSLISSLLLKMGLKSINPDSPGPHASPKTQIAVTCEATSRLTSLDTLPMNKLLGFGARYLQEYHSSWIKEHGGYENAFESDSEDEDEDEVQ
ncbi:apoptosis facilitator Bcl-2-like protein 14 [Anabas testudineus]|uniref:Apoptosis facilitator Bcl-2-like protein 14 n=1 Tax=Anabas testudineus TaxID=64144 RepID=A0A3Q1KCS2_ANATE|nr:apoptosis facilitator Bcl-2-like protein 14 [Anabas testudineus]